MAPWRQTSDLTTPCPVPTGGGAPPADTDSASGYLPAGGTLTTDGAHNGTVDDKVEVWLTTPDPGNGSIDITYDNDSSADGFSFLGFHVTIDAPQASVDDPSSSRSRSTHRSSLTGSSAETVQLFRDGELIPACAGAAGVADPDPCASERVAQDDGDVQITVLSSHASLATSAVPADACPAQAVPEDGFVDVARTNRHEANVDCITWWGITQGSGDGTYGPGQALTRGQMATFLASVLTRAGMTLPAAPADAFSDDDGTVHETAINQLAQLGLVQGTSSTTYGPGEDITRAQMGRLLVNVDEYATNHALAGGSDPFTDDDGSIHEGDIDKAAAAGFTSGKTDTTFAPGDPVLRDQMATFIANLLDDLVGEQVATPPIA